MNPAAWAAVAVATLATAHGIAWAGAAPGGAPSVLAVPLLGGGRAPSLVLAQRTIDRQWGTSEDSVYKVIEIPAWRGEGTAMVLSAAIPGLGQAYVGDRSGVWYALAEATGWVARLWWRHRADDLRADAERYAGSPDDPGSAWSFERWSAATSQSSAELRALYAADRESFYALIGSDPRYIGGWSGDPAATRSTFADLRAHSDERLKTARYAETGLWLNHVASAVEALRAARLHNIPLRPDLDLKLNGAWHGGRPSLVAALERRF